MTAITFLEGLLAVTVTASTPLLLGSLGEIISERTGVLNLGVEGIMLVGALSGYATTIVTGNPYIGLLVGAVSGIALATVHAILVVSLNADQVISGIMITILGIGLTDYLGGSYTGKSIEGMNSIYFPVVGKYLAEIPIVGRPLFYNPVPNFIALALVPIVWYLLFRTNLGLELISVGEDPRTADSSGINVKRTRYLGVLLGGAFMGVAGAHLSLVFLNFWAPEMTSGRGWIVVGLVIFARWRPFLALAGSFLFGGISAFAIRSQSLDLLSFFDLHPLLSGVAGFLLNPVILSAYPYVVTIIILVYVSRNSTDETAGVPDALLSSYTRDSE